MTSSLLQRWDETAGRNVTRMDELSGRVLPIGPTLFRRLADCGGQRGPWGSNGARSSTTLGGKSPPSCWLGTNPLAGMEPALATPFGSGLVDRAQAHDSCTQIRRRPHQRNEQGTRIRDRHGHVFREGRSR